MLKMAKLKGGTRIEKNRYNTTQRIKQYGETNSYPQDIRDFINASRTAKSCLNVFAKFVRGAGFALPLLQKLQVNKKLSLFKLHTQIVADFARFKGFAIHINYNGLLDETNYSLVPFECCRLEVNTEKELTGRIAVHRDWTNENGRTFKNADITYFDQYTPDKAAVLKLIQASPEGFAGFKGLLYYFTEEIETYPLSLFDPIRELMVTQVSADAIRVRNTKFNFLPAGVMYRKGMTPEFANSEGTEEPVKQEEDTFAKDMEAWQGDENAGKIIVLDGGSPEEELKFVEFPIKNLDKLTELTDKIVEAGIRSYMCIPPELMGIAGNRGLSAETMQESYDFYNSVTSSERDTLEAAYSEVFENLFKKNGYTDVKIAVLKYITAAAIETPPAA